MHSRTWIGFLIMVSGASGQRDATQSLYGQCGGRNWDGPIACPTGAFCYNDGNPWYSQCVSRGNGDDPLPPVTSTKITTITAGPTRVTTVITYLTPRPSPPVSTTTLTLTPDEPISPRAHQTTAAPAVAPRETDTRSSNLVPDEPLREPFTPEVPVPAPVSLAGSEASVRAVPRRRGM